MNSWEIFHGGLCYFLSHPFKQKRPSEAQRFQDRPKIKAPTNLCAGWLHLAARRIRTKRPAMWGVSNTPFREQEEAQQQARSKTVPHVFAFFVARLFAFLTCFCMCHILERALAKGLSQTWLHNYRLKSIE